MQGRNERTPQKLPRRNLSKSLPPFHELDGGFFCLLFFFLTIGQDAASHIVKVVDTVEPDPDLVKKYDEKYQKFAKIYPALKDIYSEII